MAVKRKEEKCEGKKRKTVGTLEYSRIILYY